MKTRHCNKCDSDKLEEEFYATRSWCKLCCSEYRKEKRKDPLYIQKEKERYQKKRDEYIKKGREYYHSKSDLKKKEHNRRIYELHRANPIAIERKRLYGEEYEVKNKDKRRKQRAITRRNRYWTDTAYKLEILLRTRFYKAVKRGKVVSIMKLIGCSREQLRDYLASKFKPEMNWDNHGEIWEIDHIIPINTFNLLDIKQQEKCFHYTNLQPLFKTTVIAKSFGYDEVGNMNKRNKKDSH